MSIRLGINIDHVATLRNARGDFHPDPYFVAKKIIKYGADSITIHLREDRRHIKDKDLKILSRNKSIPLNLEIASNYEILKIALKNKPNFVCIVPEKRNEITTEGGLNLKKYKFHFHRGLVGHYRNMHNMNVPDDESLWTVPEYLEVKKFSVKQKTEQQVAHLDTKKKFLSHTDWAKLIL